MPQGQALSGCLVPVASVVYVQKEQEALSGCLVPVASVVYVQKEQHARRGHVT